MHKTGWFGIGLSVLLVAGAGGRALTQAHEDADGAACGLGPPPGSPGFAAADARREAGIRSRGYELVCDANLKRFDIPWKMRSLADTRLAFEPVDLARTPFARFEAMGNQVETIIDKRSRLYRRFRMPDGHIVVLSEQDMSADGTHTERDPKDEPERIKGMAARLGIFQTPSGKAVSMLDWVEGRRYYQLWIDANVGRGGPRRDQLFALAASLPASKPACRHEPPYHRSRTGPDGLPAWDTPPVMTQADIDAIGKTCLD